MSKLMDVSDADVATIEEVIAERLALGVSQAQAQRQGVDEALAQLADERSMVMKAIEEQLGKDFPQKETEAEVSVESADKLQEVNKTPDPVASEPKESTPLEKLFGEDSTLVNEDGSPMVLYHGTTKQNGRAILKGGAFRRSKTGAMGSAVYLGGSPEASAGYDDGVMLKVYARGKYLTNMQWTDYVNKHGWAGAEKAATADGWSGVYDTQFENAVAVWNPADIKSATDNSGAFDPANPDIRYANKATQGSQWNMLPDTVGDRVIQRLSMGKANTQKLQDRFHYLLQAQKSIKAAGGAITEQFDARLAETLFPGRVKTRLDNFLEQEADPLLEAMARNKVSQDEMSDYLLARHAPERNAQIAKVNDQMPDGGAGTNSKGDLMTTAAANAYIANLSPAKKMLMDMLAKKVDAITKGTRDVLVNEGLESPSAIAAWDATYKHYVPLFKEEAEEGAAPAHPMGSGFSVKGSSSKRAMGSEKEVTNMLAHVLIAREAAITRAEKNLVGQSLYGLVLTQPNTDFWTTIRPNMSTADLVSSLQSMGVNPQVIADMDPAPTKRDIDKNTGKVVERTNTQYRSLPNAMVVKVNGEDRVIVFNAKNEQAMALANSLMSKDPTPGEILSHIAGATRFISKTLTQWNVAFGAANFVKDAIGAGVHLSSTKLAGKQLQMYANIPSAAIGIAREISGSKDRTPMSDLYRQFKEDGAETGYRDNLTDPFERAKQIDKMLLDLDRGNKLTAGKAIGATLELFSDFNHTLENAVRLSAYKVALDNGMSRKEAARTARELTVDFNRKGVYGSNIGAAYAFFNAAVQGTARTMVALQSPAGKKIIAGGLLLGVAQAVLLAAAGFDDDEISEFEKTRSLIIPTGGKNYIKIPLPPGLNALPNTGRVLAELAMYKGKDWDKKLFSTLGSIAGAFNPLGGGNVFTAHGALSTIMPTLGDPIVDLATNKNFADASISKEVRSTDPRPGYMLGRESTMRTASGQAYKGIAKLINYVGGWGEFKKGYVSPTPEEIRYIVHAVGGGLSKQVQDIVDAGISVGSGQKDMQAKNIPIGGRFSGTVEDSQLQMSRYFENVNKIEKLKTEMAMLKKDHRPQEAAEVRRQNAEARLVQFEGHVKQIIGKLNQQAAEHIDSPEKLKDLDARRTEKMRQLNERMRALEKEATAK